MKENNMFRSQPERDLYERNLLWKHFPHLVKHFDLPAHQHNHALFKPDEFVRQWAQSLDRSVQV